MKNYKKFKKNTLQKRPQLQEQVNWNKKQRRKLVKIKTYFGKSADVEKTEDYIEVTVTYEVIENIGMQEKIDVNQEQTSEKEQ